MHASEFGQEGRGLCVTACREETSGDRASPLQEDVGVGKDPMSESTVSLIQPFSSHTAVSPKIAHYKRVLNPFSQHSRTPAVAKAFQIGLRGVVEADLELLCNSWSAEVMRERMCIADLQKLAVAEWLK